MKNLVKIKIKTKGEKSVSLTVKEAKELWSQLNNIFGDKDSISELKKLIPLPYPIVIERDYYPWRYPNYPYWNDYNDHTISNNYIDDGTGRNDWVITTTNNDGILFATPSGDFSVSYEYRDEGGEDGQ